MNVALRVKTCMLIEKIQKKQKYCDEIGIKDKSHFKDKFVNEERKRY